MSFLFLLFVNIVTSDDNTSGSDSEVDNSSLCLPLNATEPTTVSNCICFTGVYSYESGGMEGLKKM
jgi:hypothetical protein